MKLSLSLATFQLAKGTILWLHYCTSVEGRPRLRSRPQQGSWVQLRWTSIIRIQSLLHLDSLRRYSSSRVDSSTNWLLLVVLERQEWCLWRKICKGTISFRFGFGSSMSLQRSSKSIEEWESRLLCHMSPRAIYSNHCRLWEDLSCGPHRSRTLRTRLSKEDMQAHRFQSRSLPTQVEHTHSTFTLSFISF